MFDGFVIVKRKIWTDPDFADFIERAAFVWLISHAVWTPTRHGNDELEVGELCYSNRFLAQAWGMSSSRVNRFLQRLIERDIISTRAPQQRDTGTIIKILKFKEYHELRDNSGTLAGQQRGRSTTKNEQIQKQIQLGDSLTAVVGEDLAKAFVAHRKEIKHPLTPTACGRLVKQLGKYDLETRKEMVEQSIKNGWQGVFELKGKPASSRPSNLPDGVKQNGSGYYVEPGSEPHIAWRRFYELQDNSKQWAFAGAKPVHVPSLWPPRRG